MSISNMLFGEQRWVFSKTESTKKKINLQLHIRFGFIRTLITNRHNLFAMKSILAACLFGFALLFFAPQSYAQDQVRLQVGKSLHRHQSTWTGFPHPASNLEDVWNAHSADGGGLHFRLAYDKPLNQRISIEPSLGFSSYLTLFQTAWFDLRTPNDDRLSFFESMEHQISAQADLGLVFKFRPFRSQKFRFLAGGYFQLPFLTAYTRIGRFIKGFPQPLDNGTFPEQELSQQPSFNALAGFEFDVGKKRDYTLRFQVDQQMWFRNGDEASEQGPRTDIGKRTSMRFEVGIPLFKFKIKKSRTKTTSLVE